MRKYALKYLQLKQWQKILVLLPISFILFFGVFLIFNDFPLRVMLKRSIVFAFFTSLIFASGIFNFHKKPPCTNVNKNA